MSSKIYIWSNVPRLKSEMASDTIESGFTSRKGRSDDPFYKNYMNLPRANILESWRLMQELL